MQITSTVCRCWCQSYPPIRSHKCMFVHTVHRFLMDLFLFARRMVVWDEILYIRGTTNRISYELASKPNQTTTTKWRERNRHEWLVFQSDRLKFIREWIFAIREGLKICGTDSISSACVRTHTINGPASFFFRGCWGITAKWIFLSIYFASSHSEVFVLTKVSVSTEGLIELLFISHQSIHICWPSSESVQRKLIRLQIAFLDFIYNCTHDLFSHPIFPHKRHANSELEPVNIFLVWKNSLLTILHVENV